MFYDEFFILNKLLLQLDLNEVLTNNFKFHKDRLFERSYGLGKRAVHVDQDDHQSRPKNDRFFG